MFAFQLGHKVHDEGSHECRGGNWDPTQVAMHQIKELKDVKVTFHSRTPKSPPLIAPSEVEVAYTYFIIFIIFVKLDFLSFSLELCLDNEIKVAVQDACRITGLVIASEVFHHLIWLKNIASDL